MRATYNGEQPLGTTFARLLRVILFPLGCRAYWRIRGVANDLRHLLAKSPQG